MHDAETRSLRRAAVILLTVSTVRWGWSSVPHAVDPGGPDVLEALVEATDDATASDAARRRPLGPNERIDPNQASAEELDRLPGIGPATAAAIVEAREAGQYFRRPEDLLVVRGIGPGLLQKITASLDWTAPPSGGASRRRSGPLVESHRVDVNRADAAELQSLPGVGPAIADRIIEARREQLFRTLDDLVRVPGIGAATVERLRARATTGREP
ncbi:MAG: helix-hairpin-helix domain-containing protein [Gemmatimonadetes bacterium]|nr:helix-hairpin-helix domain-containing protein [Gemmatimonadota bacterium]